MTQGNRRGSSVGGIRGSAILMTVRSRAARRRLRAWRLWARAMGVMALVWLLTLAPVPWPVSPVMGATFNVTTTADEVNTNGQCSLREAIINANNDDQSGSMDCAAGSGADTIVLQSGQTYTLTLDTDGGGHATDSGANNDDLDITSTITIQGNGATIERSTAVACTGSADTGKFRIFHVHSTGNLTLEDVTVQNGCALGGGADREGGAVRCDLGVVTIQASSLVSNRAGFGGAILNFYGTVTITDSSMANNNAGADAGVLSNFGTVTINRSTIANNSADDDGGAIDNIDGNVTIMGSTLSGNTAKDFGGAIHNQRTLNIINSTLSGNQADVDNFGSGDGGGIFNSSSGTANVSFATITANAARNGGGIANGGTVNIKNSIVGNSTNGGNCLNFGTLNAFGANFATDGSCTGFSNLNVPSTGPGGLNLGPLANNGGPTQTHALLSGSVAIDAVPLGQCTDLDNTPVTQDQRGVSRPQGSNCDVGAYEAPLSLVRRATLEGGGNCLLLDFQAQTYRFRTNTGDLFTGSIRVTRRGSQIHFSNLRTGDMWILGGTVTPGRGKAVLRTYSPWRTFLIDDLNLSNNTCVP